MHRDPQRWKADYERDGFLVVPDVLDADQLASLRAATDTITTDFATQALPPRLACHVFTEKTIAALSAADPKPMTNAVKLVMELPLFNPRFANLICHEALLDVIETLFGSTEFAFHNYKAIIKAPRTKAEFIWHRDLPYLEHSTPNLITAMLCLDPMTEANGATVVIPGTHRIPHGEVKPEDVNIPEGQLPAGPRVTVACAAGSAVLFHVNIVHGGGANRSELNRRNLISIWSGPDTYPVTASRYVYQGVMPRSADPARQQQVRLTFPERCRDRA